MVYDHELLTPMLPMFQHVFQGLVYKVVYIFRALFSGTSAGFRLASPGEVSIDSPGATGCFRVMNMGYVSDVGGACDLGFSEFPALPMDNNARTSYNVSAYLSSAGGRL